MDSTATLLILLGVFKNLLTPPTAQFKVPPPPENLAGGVPAGGQKGKGLGGRNFCPPAFRAEGAASFGISFKIGSSFVQ